MVKSTTDKTNLRVIYYKIVAAVSLAINLSLLAGIIAATYVILHPEVYYPSKMVFVSCKT